MSQYNLNDNVKDSFEFSLDGHNYIMRYPTLEESEDMQSIVEEAKADNDSRKMMATMYKFIDSVDGAPAIDKVLPKQNMMVIRNFNKMIIAEFKEE